MTTNNFYHFFQNSIKILLLLKRIQRYQVNTTPTRYPRRKVRNTYKFYREPNEIRPVSTECHFSPVRTISRFFRFNSFPWIADRRWDCPECWPGRRRNKHTESWCLCRRTRRAASSAGQSGQWAHGSRPCFPSWSWPHRGRGCKMWCWCCGHGVWPGPSCSACPGARTSPGNTLSWCASSSRRDPLPGFWACRCVFCPPKNKVAISDHFKEPKEFFKHHFDNIAYSLRKCNMFFFGCDVA